MSSIPLLQLQLQIHNPNVSSPPSNDTATSIRIHIHIRTNREFPLVSRNRFITFSRLHFLVIAEVNSLNRSLRFPHFHFSVSGYIDRENFIIVCEFTPGSRIHTGFFLNDRILGLLFGISSAPLFWGGIVHTLLPDRLSRAMRRISSSEKPCKISGLLALGMI